MDEYEPGEQTNTKEQHNKLQTMFQTLTCKLKAAFKSRKVPFSGNRNTSKEALVWYVKIAINRWRDLGAEVVIPKCYPINHKARSVEVGINISFDTKDCPQQLYCT